MSVRSEVLRSLHLKVETEWFYEILWYGPDTFTSLDDPIPSEPILDMEEYLNTMADQRCVYISDRRSTGRLHALIYPCGDLWRTLSVVEAWGPMGAPHAPLFYQARSLEKLLLFLGLHPSETLVATIRRLE